MCSGSINSNSRTKTYTISNMYVSYTTVDNTTNLQKTVFLTKTDNLLTVIEPKKNGEQIIYFQFGVDDFDYPYIELSSYWRNILPEDGITFTFYYFRTAGSYGNITRNYRHKLCFQPRLSHRQLREWKTPIL